MRSYGSAAAAESLVPAAADSSLPSAIASHNPHWRAFSHFRKEGFDEGRMRLADRSRPLNGTTFSVKGNIPVEGIPWTEGSAMYRSRIADRSAGIVERLRGLGASFVGVTTLTELAMYAPDNPSEPVALNPWAPDRTPGGSSAGAGVAALLGWGDFHVGTDSGGSIRNPACHCGVVGFKPSFGLLPMDGIPVYAPTVDTVGLISRSAASLAWLMSHLVPALNAGVGPVRLVYPRRYVEDRCTARMLRLAAGAMEAIVSRSVEIVEAEIPGYESADMAAGIVSLHECAESLRKLEAQSLSAGLKARIDRAALLSEEDVSDARKQLVAFPAAVAAVLQDAGALAIVTPTWPFAAPRLQDQIMDVGGRSISIDPARNCFVRPANALGGPAISIPMGFDNEAGVPVGLHLMSPRGSDGELLAAAAHLEQALAGRYPAPGLPA